MRKNHLCWILPACLAWATATVAAPATPSAAPAQPVADPLDAKAPVAPVVYRSALAAHKRLGQPEPLAWREANDRVGRIGGWRAYAREANAQEVNAPEAPASAAPAPPAPVKATPKPMPGGHGGHPTH